MFSKKNEMVEAVKGTEALPTPKPNKLTKDETGRTRSKISYIAAGPSSEIVKLAGTKRY